MKEHAMTGKAAGRVTTDDNHADTRLLQRHSTVVHRSSLA